MADSESLQWKQLADLRLDIEALEFHLEELKMRRFDIFLQLEMDEIKARRDELIRQLDKSLGWWD